jgi:hypothetical protein
MKLRSKLMMFTAAAALSANMAFAAIDGNALADDYLAEGYDFVEVKVGPTQTKVEAIKGGTKVEVIYDNETGEILKQEAEAADGDDVGRTGKQVRVEDKDFLDGDDDEGDDEEDDDDENDDDEGEDDEGDDDESDDDENDDNEGNDDEGNDDDEGDDGEGGGGESGGGDDDEDNSGSGGGED